MWNDERVETLRQLHAKGERASKIASKIGGLTKNAVIGKLHRLGLSAPTKQVLTKAQRNRGGSRRGRLSIASGAPTVRAAVIKAGGAEKWIEKNLAGPKPAPVPLPPLEPVVMRKTFEQLQDGDCRWPVGDPREDGFGFCGLSRLVGKPYCEDCCRRASNGVPAKSINQLVIKGALARLG